MAILVVGDEVVTDVVNQPGNLQLEVSRPTQRKLMPALQSVLERVDGFAEARQALQSSHQLVDGLERLDECGA